MESSEESEKEATNVVVEPVTEIIPKHEELRVKPSITSGKKGETLLQNAIAEHDIALCLCLLQHDSHVNTVDERDGSTPLHVLAREKWSEGGEVLVLLLEKGAKVNAADHAEHTPLHIAARDGRLGLCKGLLAHRHAAVHLNLNARQKSNQFTPLHYAAREGQCQVVELLLHHGADASLQDKGNWLAVHHAASQGYKDSCRLLAFSYTHASIPDVPPPIALTALKGYHRCCTALQPDAGSLRYRDTAGNTPLHVVAKNGFYIFVKILLDLGAPLDERNSSGNTPLMEAVKKKKLECVKMLVERGASLAEGNHEHSTVLHLAASSRAHKCLEYLLSCKNIEYQLNVEDDRDLSALFIAAKKMDEKSFTLLIEAGASPTCSPGESLLHFRPVHRHPVILSKMLSHHGSDVNFSDNEGVTPLHLAADVGCKESCILLLGRGARLNALDNCGKSSVYMAAAAGNAEVLRLLVNNAALLRPKEYKKKFTALHAAAAAGRLECCKILLNADSGLGKELNDANKYAVDMALENVHHQIVALLLQNFKSLPDSLRQRLHECTHRSLHNKDRMLLEVIFRSKWWQVGCGLDRAVDRAPCPNFRDIIRPYPNIASEIMTRCRKGSLNDFRLLENTSYLHQGDSGGKACWQGLGQRSAEGSNIDQHPVGVMVGCEQLSLLQHPLVEAWLNYKWCSYARLLFLLLLLLRLFAVAALISFLLYTMNWTQIEKKYNLTEEEICGGVSLKDGCMQEPLTPWPCPGALPALLVHLLLAFSLLLQVVTELVALRKTGKRHMEETFLMRLPSMCLTLAALLPTSTCELTSGIKSVYAWECGILALLLTWLDLIYNINRLPQFTMFSGINVKFFKGYVKGLLYLAMMVFVFSFAFHLLLGDQVSFHSVPLSMVQVVVWMIGDLNYNDNFLNARLDYPLLSISLFLLFVCTVGAFFITLLKTPSTNKKQLRYYKQTGRIYLLLKIDIRFPWVRNLGLTYEFNDRQPIPSMFVKIMKHMVYGEDPRKETRPLRNFPKRQDQTDTAIPPARNSIYCGAEKLMAYFENMANFIQMDDMDDEEDKDDGGAVKKVLEEHGKKLDELMSRFDQYKLHCEERLNLLDLKQRPGKPKTISNQQYNIQT